MLRWSLALPAAVMLLISGCSPARVVWYHQVARDRLLSLQEDQIQDNLVRIRAGRPFLHVNYESIKGVSSDEYSGKGSVGDDDTETVTGGGTIIEVDSQPLPSAEAGFKFSDQFEVAAKPVMGNKTVYDAYIAFAEMFMEEGEPEEGAYLWKRQSEMTGTWFHVPQSAAHRKAYERLVLLTTLDQGATRKLGAVQIIEIETVPAKAPSNDVKVPDDLIAVHTFPAVSLGYGWLHTHDGSIQLFRVSTGVDAVTSKPTFGIFALASDADALSTLVGNPAVMLEYESAPSGGGGAATIKIGNESTNIQVKP